MKKKFVLTLALVLMVAASLVAATPVEVSGSFKTGYEFKFASTNAAKQIEDTNEAELVTFLDFTGDFWKVSLNAGSAVQYHDEQGVQAKAEIYLDKALAEQGVDMGDIALTLHVGTGVSGDASSVLADKNEFRKKATISKVTLASNADTFGITLGYSDLVKVYFSANPTNNDLPMVVGATVTPLDGVSVAAGFTNSYKGSVDNALTVSAKADVATLADLDFTLVATGELILDLGAEKNMINADVVGGYEGVEAWVAYQKYYDGVNKLAVKVGYETDIEDFTVSASVKAQMNDLSNIVKATSEYTVAAGAKYAMGGATYALDAKYEVNAEAFYVTPSVSISF
ncbi:MAG: hypothetical protein EOM15_12185 [Spirochaetia bacterium]|nr:hypothetical protein [Spirochaetia bacterium]NCC65403.1 hypothetical protein [Spirochaetia bacterium]